jgi:hypothetical protein
MPEKQLTDHYVYTTFWNRDGILGWGLGTE